MHLNQFIWNNYKDSKAGQEVIKLFEEGTFEEIIKKFIEQKNKSVEDLIDFANDLLEIAASKEEVENAKFFEYILNNGLLGIDEENKEEFDIYLPNDYDFIFNTIEPLTLYLFEVNKEKYLPYFFQLNFLKLQQIADAFNVGLPSVPLRKNKEERAKYYLEFCEIWQEFGIQNNLNPFELCAFLYDFAPKFIGEKGVENLPEPTNIWMTGASKEDYYDLNKSTLDTTYFWSGNEDTKKGDIIVMYCLSPRSNIEFICRAVNDGIRDPFFHYYGSITVGHIQKVESIHISELKSDEHFKELPIVRKNLQGVNGTQINNEDYQRILKILSEKGQDISILPKLSSVDFKPNSDCKNEREVEVKIVEPFLNQIGYTESDWIRQLPVRMGRGERNYPDYVFFAETKKGYERAKMLLETKFIIKSNRELEETFQQAHSYALRLSAEIIIISDRDYFWIYLRKNGSFDRTKYTKHNWQELNNADVFNQIKKIIGKEFLK